MTEVVLDPGELPIGPYDHKGPGWWGVLCLIGTEAALFAYLLFSYFYFDVQLPHSWRPAEPPDLKLAGPNTLILIASSVAVFLGEKAMRKGRRGQAILEILVGFLLGVVFVVIQYFEWKSKHFTPQTSPYGSLFYTVTGFHVAHVLAGLIALFMTLIWSGLGYFDAKRNAAVTNVSVYWHFVDVVWLVLYALIYLAGRK